MFLFYFSSLLWKWSIVRILTIRKIKMIKICLQKNFMTFLYLFVEILIIIFAICMQCITVCAIPYFMFFCPFYLLVGNGAFYNCSGSLCRAKAWFLTNLVHNCLITVMKICRITCGWNAMPLCLLAKKYSVPDSVWLPFFILHFWSFPFTLITFWSGPFQTKDIICNST